MSSPLPLPVIPPAHAPVELGHLPLEQPDRLPPGRVASAVWVPCSTHLARESTENAVETAHRRQSMREIRTIR